MATARHDSGPERTPAYPNISEAAWWQLRKIFKKDMPKVFNEEYLIDTGVRKDTKSAMNLVRPLKRFGFFGDDGKPLDRVWDWIEDEKYSQVCNDLLHDLYPPEITDVFTSTDDATRSRLENSFQRKQGIKAASAKQYASFYMLLLAADLSKQSETGTQKPAKVSQPSSARMTSFRPRSSGARIHTPVLAPSAQASLAGNTRDTPNAAEGEHPHTHRPEARGIEPSLNINIQIHIPVEATAEQIDQIFKSMGKHLYQRQDVAAE